MDKYITKKFPKNLVGRLRRLKAKMELKKNYKVTEGDVITLALLKLEEEMEKENRRSIFELAGAIKGKKRSNADEIDKVVYGI